MGLIKLPFFFFLLLIPLKFYESVLKKRHRGDIGAQFHSLFVTLPWYSTRHFSKTEGSCLGKGQINQFNSPEDLITRTKNILITGAQTKTQDRNREAGQSLSSTHAPRDAWTCSLPATVWGGAVWTPSTLASKCWDRFERSNGAYSWLSLTPA